MNYEACRIIADVSTFYCLDAPAIVDTTSAERATVCLSAGYGGTVPESTRLAALAAKHLGWGEEHKGLDYARAAAAALDAEQD